MRPDRAFRWISGLSKPGQHPWHHFQFIGMGDLRIHDLKINTCRFGGAHSASMVNRFGARLFHLKQSVPKWPPLCHT